MLFSCCKGETHTHRAGFKQLFRRLRALHRPEKLDTPEDLCLEVLLGGGAGGTVGAGGSSSGPAVLVLGCPTQPFTAAEFDVLRAFIAGGGSLLVAAAEGGEAACGSNLNYLLEEGGIAVNADVVVRTSPAPRYHHPKEALIADGLLNRALLAAHGGGGAHGGKVAAAASAAGRGGGSGGMPGGTGAGAKKGLTIVYPYGCTLSVQPPAVPILSSGRISYPMQRPLGERAAQPAATHSGSSSSSNGRRACVGWAHAALTPAPRTACACCTRSGVLVVARARRRPAAGAGLCGAAV